MTDAKPYRPNVGIVLFNLHGHVLIARRFSGRATHVQPGQQTAAAGG